MEWKSSVKILLMVNTSPWGSSRSGVALRFLRAALARRHELSAIYFRADGVYHALPGRQADPGTEDLSTVYAELARAHHIELLLCSAAVTRRFSENATGFQDPWRVAGLARWVELLDQSERLVAF